MLWKGPRHLPDTHRPNFLYLPPLVTERVRPCPHVLPLSLPPSPQPQPHTLQSKCCRSLSYGCHEGLSKEQYYLSLFPLQGLCLKSHLYNFHHVSVTSCVWPQLPFLFLCLPFFLFSFLTLPQYPEPYFLVHMCLLKRRLEEKTGRGRLCVEFTGELLVSVVCEMDVAVPPQKREGEGA